VGKYEKNFKEKSFGFGNNNFGSETDTEIGPWSHTTTGQKSLQFLVHNFGEIMTY
jgi:hypothetical protein